MVVAIPGYNAVQHDITCAEIGEIAKVDTMDLIRALSAFTRITETGSFAAVSRELHTSHSVVTRLVADLETHFGVRLFHRSTRRLTLTEDGRDLLGHARQMLDLAEEMETALGRQRSSAQGHVRVGTSVGFGRFLTPRIPTLLERHPGLSFELLMRDHFGDMIEERLDVALRRGPIADTSLVTRALGTFRRVAVASPVYLERRGAPRTPHELTEHDCLLHLDHSAGGGWRFDSPDGVIEITVTGRFGADNSEAVRAAALAGQGIAMLWETQVVDDLRAGRLYPVLADFRSPGEPVFVVYPSRRHLPPRTRAVIDFLVELSRELREPLGPDGQPINAWLV